MAIYHLHAQMISRADGRSAVACAAYRSGQAIEDKRTGQTFDYTRKQTVEESFIMAPENAPEWARDRASLWNEVEAKEKRKDAQLARELDVALPEEMNADQRRELLKDFVQRQFVKEGMIADVSIHDAPALGDKRNHHAHIMLTTRTLTEDGFGNKNREWNERDFMQGVREQWAEITNQHLERAGRSERIDHRTLEAQRTEAMEKGDYQKAVELSREPQEHQGVIATNMSRYRKVSERMERYSEKQPSGEDRRISMKIQMEAVDLADDAKGARSAVNRAEWEYTANAEEFQKRRAELLKEIEREKAQPKQEITVEKQPEISRPEPPPVKEKTPIERALEDREYFKKLFEKTEKEFVEVVKRGENAAKRAIGERQKPEREQLEDWKRAAETLRERKAELEQERKNPLAIFKRKDIDEELKAIEERHKKIAAAYRNGANKINGEISDEAIRREATKAAMKAEPQLAQLLGQLHQVRQEWEKRDEAERQAQRQAQQKQRKGPERGGMEW